MHTKVSSLNCSNPNVNAALLIGPPISTAIIPPKISPNNIALAPPKPFNQLVNASFKATTGGFTTFNINTPVSNKPNTGYNKTGLIPSNCVGKPTNTFFKPSTI